jgi:uncharacterized protein HemX
MGDELFFAFAPSMASSAGTIAVLIPILAVIGIFILPVWTAHQRKMMELKLQAGQKADDNLLQELQSLKAQITDLRDTTTRYDMSFDSALQRIESRVGHLETRVSSMEQPDGSSQSVNRL